MPLSVSEDPVPIEAQEGFYGEQAKNRPLHTSAFQATTAPPENP